MPWPFLNAVFADVPTTLLNLDGAFVDLECPRCRYPFDVQLLDVRVQARVFCPNCKVGIQLVDEEASTEVGLRTVDRSVNRLDRALRRLGS
jgi:phage FluMu protein Com